MARPTTKESLIGTANKEFEKLWKQIDAMTEDKQQAEFSFDDRDRNLRDVLVHLYEWHQLLLKWGNSNKENKTMNFLPEPYNWKTYPLMNIEFWKKHQTTSLTEAKAVLKKSHSDVMRFIDFFTDEELFTKKYFPWTGTTSLGSYCVSATSSHYNWAIKKIKLHLKS